MVVERERLTWSYSSARRSDSTRSCCSSRSTGGRRWRDLDGRYDNNDDREEEELALVAMTNRLVDGDAVRTGTARRATVQTRPASSPEPRDTHWARSCWRISLAPARKSSSSDISVGKFQSIGLRPEQQRRSYC